MPVQAFPIFGRNSAVVRYRMPFKGNRSPDVHYPPFHAGMNATGCKYRTALAVSGDEKKKTTIGKLEIGGLSA
jgi:hypothetical protein